MYSIYRIQGRAAESSPDGKCNYSKTTSDIPILFFGTSKQVFWLCCQYIASCNGEMWEELSTTRSNEAIIDTSGISINRDIVDKLGE